MVIGRLVGLVVVGAFVFLLGALLGVNPLSPVALVVVMLDGGLWWLILFLIGLYVYSG